MPVCFAHDLVVQICGGFFTVCGKAQIQRQNVRRLRAAGDAAARCNEFLPDRIADLVCKRLQLCLRFGIAQRVCGPGCQRNRVQIIAAGNQRFRRLTEFDCFRRVKREPSKLSTFYIRPQHYVQNIICYWITMERVNLPVFNEPIQMS